MISSRANKLGDCPWRLLRHGKGSTFHAKGNSIAFSSGSKISSVAGVCNS
jgi:hypothetical protein